MNAASRTLKRSAVASGALAAAAVRAAGGTAGLASAAPGHGAEGKSRHVLFLSVDGMHRADLQWFVTTHPHSALASLVRRGAEFTDARTPFPSDSFPGLIGPMTGGNPKTTGIYYDVSYNHALIDPGASADPVPDPAVCTHPVLGANVAHDESSDLGKCRPVGSPRVTVTSQSHPRGIARGADPRYIGPWRPTAKSPERAD